MTIEGFSVSRDSDIVTVLIDRPARRNAVTLAMWRGLTTMFGDFARDPSIRGVVFGGAGGVFSAGADIAEFEQTRSTPEQVIVYEEAVEEACDAIAALGRPVVAAIEGFCYGGACNLAMACDFRFVAPAAKMAIPAVRLSIVYSVRGMARLLALVGLTEAKRIFYSGEPFDAERALAKGFADAVTADPVGAAREYLASLKAGPPLAVAGAKLILNSLSHTEGPFDRAAAEAVTHRAAISEDYAEGRRAFAEKRPPQFRGR